MLNSKICMFKREIDIVIFKKFWRYIGILSEYRRYLYI